jgi:DNA-binding CsgD family transcriptional regulator
VNWIAAIAIQYLIMNALGGSGSTVFQQNRLEIVAD